MQRDLDVCCIGQTPLMLIKIQDLVLNEKGMKIGSSSGVFREAARNLTVFQPDVIVIAAGESFPELGQLIQGIHRASKAPIIIAGGDIKMKVAAERAGAHDFVSGADAFSSPTKRRDLLGRIHKAVAPRSSPILHRPVATPKGKLRTGFSGVLALGASCGGTEAIFEVVKRLPANIPGMAIVQHMPAGFTKTYADRLNRECPPKVVEAVGLHKMETGKILLAPGDMQMRVVRKADGYYTETFQGGKVSGHRPSVDVLFNSVAKCAGKKAVGIILTGMGADGAKGLLEMRKAGAFTIGQDERTSVVYGMPRVAFESGAVQKQVPLREVAPSLLQHLVTAR